MLRMLIKSFSEDFLLLTYKIKGKILKSFKNYNGMIKTYKKAAEKTGQINQFYTEMGDVSLKVKNPYRAVEYYKNALKSSPNDVTLWAKLASTLKIYYKDNVDEIANCYSHLAELDPENHRVYYELGLLYLQQEEKLNAVSSFK